MRAFIIALLCVPVFTYAQFSRSAKELAGENIEQYLQKIYKGKHGHTIQLGEPQACHSKAVDVEWEIPCRVTFSDENKKNATDKSFSNFVFYLNREMKVMSAEAYKPK